MNLKSHAQIYETIGRQYSGRRQPDPRIAAAIRAALGEVKTLCNIGAGSGSYEPDDIAVTAVEPSEIMISQRTSPAQVVRAVAEDLPFNDNEFDAAMAVLSVHHWEDPALGLAEMRRISKRQVVFAFDHDLHNSFWLLQEYLPEIIEFEDGRGIPLQKIIDQLQVESVIPVPIPHDCVDGFQAAYWRRPELYLETDVQANISTFAQLPQNVIRRGMDKLKSDLESGLWYQQQEWLLDKAELDFGYRILVSS